MRAIICAGLTLAMALSFTATPAGAAKYSVACTAPGGPACKTACSSNTHTVACYARVVNGKCQKACGVVR